VRIRSSIAVLAVLAACQKAETPEQAQARMSAESDSARASIEQNMQAFARHVNAGHADSLAALYADDAVLMPPNMPAATGRAAIQEAFAGMMQGGATTIRFAVQSVSANGPLAVERGTYSYTMTPAGGGPAMADSGKYLVHWHRIAGRWMIVEDAWNSDVAVPEPAPAGRRRS
jgi:uncharacterized protein (TIGR02246 family)